MNQAFAIIKTYLPIFLCALLLRLVLMPFLFHPDIKTQYFHGQYLGQGVGNIYRFISDNKTTLPYKDTFNYPPTTYYFLGSWALVTQPVLGSEFRPWLMNWSETSFSSPQIFRYVFILKLPYLFADLACGVLLALLIKETLRKRVLLIWFFNPISLYIIYGMGNFDIIPSFLTVLSVVLFDRNRYAWSGLALGLGIGTKVFPALFVPIFLIMLLKKQAWRGLLWFCIVMGVTTLLPMIFVYPDVLSISGSGLLTKIFAYEIPIGYWYLPVFIPWYAGLIIASWFLKPTRNSIIFFIVAALAIVYVLTEIHPQWLLWSLPFLCLYAAQSRVVLWLLVPVAISFFVSLFGFEDRFLTVGIFSPILPYIYDVGFIERTLFTYISQTILSASMHWLLAISVMAIVIWQIKTLTYEVD